MQLHAKLGSINFKHYAASKGIEPIIYKAHMDVPESSTPSPPLPAVSMDESHNLSYTFTSLLSYASTTSDIAYNSPAAYTACNNKEDILTQSQMFKATDAAEFIKCQKDEIDGLTKFNVMEIHKIADLPPRAKLISSIWSYRRK
jgi:hypothetical protein